jgi:hypothetical protein
VQRREVLEDPGVVDDDVEPVEPFEDHLSGGSDELGAGDIHADRNPLATCDNDLRRDALGGRRVDVGRDDGRALDGEPQGDRPPIPAPEPVTTLTLPCDLPMRDLFPVMSRSR